MARALSGLGEATMDQVQCTARAGSKGPTCRRNHGVPGTPQQREEGIAERRQELRGALGANLATILGKEDIPLRSANTRWTNGHG